MISGKKHCTNEDYDTDFESDKHFASEAYDVRSSEKHIQEEIQTNGPVEAAFTGEES